MEQTVHDVTHYMLVDPTKRSDRQRVFCKRHHGLLKVSDLVHDKCPKCPYFKGTGQGDVIMCRWEDISDRYERTVFQDRMENEFKAVSGYIDRGILKKG